MSSSNSNPNQVSARKEGVTYVLDDVLADKQRIVSHAGTGQYQLSAGPADTGTSSISACGLAAMNCARILFQQAEDMKESCQWCRKRGGEHGRSDGQCLVEAMLSPETAEDIVSICSSWTSNSHLEVEELLQLPVFKKAFLVVNTKYGQTSQSDFRTLLMDMAQAQETSESKQVVACIITRPPEIVLCMKIPISGQDVFIIFDSHPRPTHPNGSGFILNSSLVGTADYLDHLLSIDSSILADPSLRWQAELLGHFSGHIVVSRPNTTPNYEIDEILMEATLQILLLKSELAQVKRLESTLTSENEYLNGVVNDLEKELERSQTPPVVDRKGKGRAIDPQPSSSQRRFESSRATAYDQGSSGSLSGSQDHEMSLAEHLQAEFDEEDRLIARERERLLQNNKTFDCRICFDTLPQDSIAKVEGCDHAFCRECLRNHVSSTINSRRYPIQCPACTADNARKPRFIDDTTAMTLGISEATFEILQELQLTKHSTILHCRKCRQTMFVDKNEYKATKLVVCPLRGCNNVWCKDCEQTIVVGGPQHSCDGSNELQHLMKQRGWRHCPGCQTPIQKESGCSHMTCMSPGCNTHFCYVCGELITQSISRKEIGDAISRHYARCNLFQDVGGP